MNTQKSSRLKMIVIVTFVLAGFGVTANWVVTAHAADQIRFDQNQKAPAAMTFAQSATQTPTPQETETSSESQEPESNIEQKKETAEPKEKPLRNFRPSEQIEAEQAVDFPYDI